MAGRRRRIEWTQQARSALDDILDYIATDSPQGARAVLKEALRVAESLATLSERGRVVPELNEPTIRELFAQNYRLLYEVAEDEVRILGFIHGARDFARWRRDE